MDQEIHFLKEALRLAKNGLSWTNPNPLVGAVIVKNSRIIGRGFHRKAGLPHAEIEALNSIKEGPQGATLYVNLEPCAFFGKTPPCIEAIIKSKIKRVVCSTKDPNLKVNGTGLTALKKAGIETSVGFLQNEARKLNEAFFTFHEKKRPFVVIKFAASLDGKLATTNGDSKWITCESARKYARLLRANHQAVLVGINTVLRDNPHLGVRMKGKKDPLRIILDPLLQMPLNSQILHDNNVILVASAKAKKNKMKAFESNGFTVLVFNTKNISIPNLLSVLYEKEIISILVEGGGKTLGNFLDSKMIDKVYAFHAPILLGGKNAVSIEGNGIETIDEAISLKDISHKKFDDNLLTIGYVN